jgi:hypothetical protein
LRQAAPAEKLPAAVSRQVVPAEKLPAKARAKADERHRFIQLVQAVSRDEQLPLPKAAQVVAQRYSDSFAILTTSGKNGVSALTYDNYRRWNSLLKGRKGKDARDVLADSYRRGIQEPRGDGRFWKYLYSAYLSENRLAATVAYDVAVKRLRLDDPEIVPPTLHQARYRLNQLDADIRILGRFGESALKNKCLYSIVRDWSGIQPGELVVGDNRTFDTRIRIFDEDKQKWVAVRPNICALIDARSWYVAAWTISPAPIGAVDIVNTLAIYVGLYGTPPTRGAYFDNGKDFCAQGFSTPLVTPDGYRHSIFNELGMSLTNSIAYNAQAKTVERVFCDQMNQFDKLFADYLGSKADQRTMAAAYFDQHPEELPSLDQFMQAFIRWLDQWHNKPKKGHIHKGETPAEIWSRRPRPESRLSEQQYRMAFAMPVGVRKVGRGPAVSVNKVLYYCDELKLEQTVLVKRDIVKPEILHLYSTDGAFIGFGEAWKPMNAMAESPEERERLGRLIARRRRQEKAVKTALKMKTGGMHVISAIELLTAPPDAQLLKMGEIGSVKGSSHRYVRYELAKTMKRLPEGKPSANVEMQDEAVDESLLAMIHDARHPENDREQISEDLKKVLAEPDQDDVDEMDFRSLYAASEEN